jgi:mannose-1-phosphate guanylyltransferase
MAKGMILAAGQGTRVRPLTQKTPKPMVPILGKPVLEYIIEHLARHGIREIMINVAFNHYKIENHFGDGRRWGVEIGYSYEGAREHGDIVPRAMGSAGGMRKIQDFGGFFDETTLVMCGDAIVDLDIGAALEEHRHKQALASVVTLDVPRDQVQNYGVVVADEQGRVRSFQEKPRPEDALSTAASTGIYIFEPAVLGLVPPGKPFDIGSELFPMLVERELPFFAQKRFFNWIDIGRLSDYWLVLQRVLRGEIAQMEMPGKTGAPRRLGRAQHLGRLGFGAHRGPGLHWLEHPRRGRRPRDRPDLDRPRQPPAGRQHRRAQRAVRIHPHRYRTGGQRAHHVTPVLCRPAWAHPLRG